MNTQPTPVSNKTDLAIVVPSLCRYGGAEIFLLECIARWQSELSVTLYAMEWSAALLSEYGVELDQVVVRPLSSPRHDGMLESLAVLPKIWETEIERHDVYLTYLYPAHYIGKSPVVSLISEPIRMLYDLRFLPVAGENGEQGFHIYPRRDYQTRDDIFSEAEMCVLEQLDQNLPARRLVTMSHSMAGYLERIYQRPVSDIVYPGVDHPVGFVDRGPSGTALSVGRLWAHKRVHRIIEALALTASGRLQIIGEGPERKRLEQLAEKLGVANRVKFLGAVSREVLAAAYCQADFVVYIPLGEPFGMVPVEAAAAGLPSIVCRGGGYGEVLSGSAVCYVEPEPEAVAVAMQRWFNSPTELRTAGELARRCALKISWQKTAGQLLEIMLDTAGSAPAVTRPLLGAHYYVWYQTDPVRHWNDNQRHGAVCDMPLAGPYTSSDPQTIQRHLEQFTSARLDFIVVNWQITATGLSNLELESTRQLFRGIRRGDHVLYVSVLLSIETADPTPVILAIDLLQSEFLIEPGYQRCQGKPLVWLFLSNELPGQVYYQGLLERLQRLGICVVVTGAVSATSLNPRHFNDVVAGWTSYSPLTMLNPEPSAMGAEADPALRVSTVSPGFDDEALSGYERSTGSVRLVDRADGATFATMLSEAGASDPCPDLIVITSFNEFHEQTHIEPSVRHSEKYIELCAAFGRTLERSADEENLDVVTS